VSRAEAPALAVVGAINLDLVVAGDRLPGPGETVVGRGPATFGGGKGANAAVAAARAGGEVLLVGAVGTDGAGNEALSELEREGIDLSGVARLADEPTGVALIAVDAAGENQIAVGAGANHAFGAAEVRAALEPRLPSLGCVLVSTEISDAAVLAAVEVAVAAGVRCILNPAPATAAAARSARLGALLTPNLGELRQLLAELGTSATGDVVVDAAALSRLCGAPTIVTRGREGALIVDGEERLEVPAPTADPVDTTGAGDTFNGVLATCLAAGGTLGRAAQLAVAAAAISVGSLGARDGMPKADRIEAAAQPLADRDR
jgi:ribokinase